MAKRKTKIKMISRVKRGRKRSTIITEIHINNVSLFWTWFRPCGGYKSYGYKHRGEAWQFFSGKKRMMKAFLKEVKENVRKEYDF